ncbi:HEPN domain-containing protein [Nocardia huaxiensis]|uniref:Uncharacterized protein n=1 Tax=Nocardia huaxiensis TaxID=2755382 RepID=A0A7D6V8J8_9NOCA|nr:HEPN domain-containing protein [Nocardia huaxiensis]QLY29374.1 hypothetical protein H0264_29520 [Nocardia huaxiensis]UFS97144.1 hypothetical protein LPY97_04210 [Nocardia huaxiensis]
MPEATQPAVIKPEFIASMRDFTIDALSLLHDKYGAPKFYRPRYADRHAWYRDSKDRETLRRKPLPPVWKVIHDYTEWPDWKEIRLLPSYSKMLKIVSEDEILQRRIRIAYRAPYETVSLSGIEEMSGLDLLMQDKLLSPLINTKLGLEFSEPDFLITSNEISKALADMRVQRTIITPLRQVYSHGTTEVLPGCIIRDLTDAEITSGEGFKTLPVEHTPTGLTYILQQHQAGIIQASEFEIDVDAESEEFERQVARALKPPKDELSDVIVASINTLCERGACARGEAWVSMRTSSASWTMREGTEYHDVRAAYQTTCCELSTISIDDLSNLISDLRKPHVIKQLNVAVERLTTAVNRISDSEAVLDLAIAAESLFGTREPGETTFKTSLNAALFLGTQDLPSSHIRKFFKTTYATRSRIVHGHNKLPKEIGEGGIAELRNELTGYIRTAILKAASELRNNNNALDWEQQLDAIIDSRNSIH